MFRWWFWPSFSYSIYFKFKVFSGLSFYKCTYQKLRVRPGINFLPQQVKRRSTISVSQGFILLY